MEQNIFNSINESNNFEMRLGDNVIEVNVFTEANENSLGPENSLDYSIEGNPKYFY